MLKSMMKMPKATMGITKSMMEMPKSMMMISQYPIHFTSFYLLLDYFWTKLGFHFIHYFNQV